MSKMQKFFVPLHKFDKSRFGVNAPTTRKNKYGALSTSMQLYYKNDKGVKCVPLIQLAEQFSYGVQENHKFNTKEEAKCVDTLEGYQLTYYFTSADTVETPTKDERYSIETVEYIYNAVYDAICEATERAAKVYEAKGGKKKGAVEAGIGLDVYNCFKTAMEDDDRGYALKKLMFHGKDKQTKEYDPSTPLRSYLKLQSFGKGKDISVSSIFVLPGKGKGTRKSAVEFVDVRGNISPGVLFKEVYLGSHMTQSYKASIRCPIVEACFTPVEGGDGGTGYMVNNAEGYDTASDSEDDGGFKSDPVAKLDKIVEETTAIESSEEDNEESEEEPDFDNMDSKSLVEWKKKLNVKVKSKSKADLRKALKEAYENSFE